MDLFRDDDRKKDVPFVPFIDFENMQKRTKSQVFMSPRPPSVPKSFTHEKKEPEAKSADDGNTVKSHIPGTVISKQDVIKAQDYIKSNFGYDINE